MLIVPIFISLLLNHHFEATHDFFGRTKHSLSNITSLIENFHDPQKLLFFNFLKYLALSFIKEGAISIYVTYALAFYLISRYRKEEIKNLKYFTISLFIFFILFAIWRLYLYYFTLEFTFALKGHSLTRYLGSYMLAFALLSALFIKLAIANAEPFPKRLKAILVFIFLVSIITIIINALRVSRNYNEYEKAINDTTSNILTMLEKDMPIDFDYSGKKGNFWCFYINYKLAPYNKEEELQKCLNYDSANAKIPDINQKKTGGIIYQPFLSKIISDEL